MDSRLCPSACWPSSPALRASLPPPAGGRRWLDWAIWWRAAVRGMGKGGAGRSGRGGGSAALALCAAPALAPALAALISKLPNLPSSTFAPPLPTACQARLTSPLSLRRSSLLPIAETRSHKWEADQPPARNEDGRVVFEPPRKDPNQVCSLSGLNSSLVLFAAAEEKAVSRGGDSYGGETLTACVCGVCRGYDPSPRHSGTSEWTSPCCPVI